MSFEEEITPSRTSKRVRNVGKRKLFKNKDKPRSNKSKNAMKFSLQPRYVYSNYHRLSFYPHSFTDTQFSTEKNSTLAELYRTVTELHERETISSNLGQIANELLNENRTEIKMDGLEKICKTQTLQDCTEIFSYLPFDVLEKTRKKAMEVLEGNNVRHKANFGLNYAKNQSLLRKNNREMKFWLTRKIDEKELDNDIKLPNYISNPISIFENDNYFNPRLKYRSLTMEESEHYSMPCNKQMIPPGPSDLPSVTLNRKRFLRNFKAFSNKSLETIPFKNTFISGSAVTLCLMPLPDDLHISCSKIEEIEFAIYESLPLPNEIIEIIISMVNYEKEQKLHYELVEYYNEIAPSSDIDIFFKGKSRLEAFESLEFCAKSIIDNYIQQNIKYKLIRSHNAINIISGNGFRNIQLIISFVQDIREILSFADLDCTSVAFDGSNIWGSERSIRAFNTRWNFVLPASLKRPSYRNRLQKYEERGFGNLFYEICKHKPRCDIKPSSLTLSNLSALENSTTVFEDVFSLTYSPTMSLEQILFNLQGLEGNYRATKRKYPWIVADSLSELYLSQDNLHETISNSNGKLFPIRWKRQDSIYIYSYLLPKCYMCNYKRVSLQQNPFENTIIPLCKSCNKLNEEKRNQKADLRGKIALVTGGRIKVGYECVVSLLRNGAFVIITTRFPYDACDRLQKENDYPLWKDNFHIYGLDFRNLMSVQKFIEHVKNSYKKLDILINNAAQTIHRPPAYYEKVAKNEFLCHDNMKLFPQIKYLDKDPFLLTYDVDNTSTPNDKQIIPVATHAGALLPLDSPDVCCPLFSSQYTLVPVIPSDHLDENEKQLYFPNDKFDEHNEPIDLRKQTSWNTKIQEVHPIELLEVQLVNSMIPSMLISQFTNLLEMACKNSNVAFIINVTSAEGQFAAPKYGGHHAHTNMAKAALNMLTRTIAETMVTKGIYVNSVDTGWITKMTPGGVQTAESATAPLIPADGAARILDPIYVAINNPTETPSYGVLFKHFDEADW